MINMWTKYGETMLYGNGETTYLLKHYVNLSQFQN